MTDRPKTNDDRSGLADVYCASCGLDRSNDMTLTNTKRSPCLDCGRTALQYRREFTATARATASFSSVLTPGDQNRDWRARWEQLEKRLLVLETPRHGQLSAESILAAERELCNFYVDAYHMRDSLIAAGMARKQIDDAIDASTNLALLADLANLDKHFKRDPNRRPRSGQFPTLGSRQGQSEQAGWRLVLPIEHGSKRLDGLTVARDAMTAWRDVLTKLSLLLVEEEDEMDESRDSRRGADGP